MSADITCPDVMKLISEKWQQFWKWKKHSQRCKHCVRWSQKISPAADPLPGARDGQNLISWRWSVPLPTNPVWWGSMHAISSYRGNRPTNTQTQPQTHRQDPLQHTAPQPVHSVKMHMKQTTSYHTECRWLPTEIIPIIFSVTTPVLEFSLHSSSFHNPS